MGRDSQNQPPDAQSARITSIDALRGFVMFMMIFVNDLAGAGKTVPDWMVHFSDRHHRGESGMTFVDLVFPAFLFIVGMSIPFALGARTGKGEPKWTTVAHIILRTISLLSIGILMVHETPDTAALGWSGNWWTVLMYTSAIAAFCSMSPPAALPKSKWHTRKIVNRGVRLIGIMALVWLAFAFRGSNGERIISLSPLALSTKWYGILGLIAWAYLVTSLVYLLCDSHRTAILGCMALLMCLFVADRKGTFEGFWLKDIVGIGEMLGSLPAISVGGLLLGSLLIAADGLDLKARTRFTFWFVAACATAALLLNPLYGISKNSATPSWCLWACAITAALWYGFYVICDVGRVNAISRPLALAGQNVLLAYLLSEMLPGLLEALHLGDWYGHLATNVVLAVIRSALCGTLILLLSISLNRAGLRVKL